MKANYRMKRLRNHPLVKILARNKGNPSTLVLIEPLWGIPYNPVSYTHLDVYKRQIRYWEK